MSNMKAIKATKNRTCNTCQAPCEQGTWLLLDPALAGDAQQVGCANCKDPRILSEITRLMNAPAPAPAPRPAAKPWAGKNPVWKELLGPPPGGRCHNCGAIPTKGEMVGKWGERDGGNWEVIRCGKCPDLSPADKRRLAVHVGTAEQTDGNALSSRAGGYTGAWTIIQTAAQNGDTGRIDAAVAAFGSAAKLHAAMNRLAMESAKLAECGELSWLGAWDSACAAGFLPGKGADALAYLVPRKGVCYDLSYKAYHQLGHRDGVTATEHVVWGCEQILGMLARDYRAALHVHKSKTHPSVLAARAECETNGALWLANRLEADMGEAMASVNRGADLPREALTLYRRAQGATEGRDAYLSAALRVMLAERAMTAIDTAPEKYSADDDGIVRALLIPEYLGGWLAYDWYATIDAERPPLRTLPPSVAWRPPAVNWRDDKGQRYYTVYPVEVYAVGRWVSPDGRPQAAWTRLDIEEVHTRATRGGGGVKREPNGGLSASVTGGAWGSDYLAMVRKTALRDLFTHGKIPLSGKTQQALATDADGEDVYGDITRASEIEQLASIAQRRYGAPLQIAEGAPGYEMPESAPAPEYAYEEQSADW